MAVAAVVSLVVGLAGGFFGSQLAIQQMLTVGSQGTPANPFIGDEESQIIAVAKQASQAVVSVIVSKKVSQAPNPNDFIFSFPFTFEQPQVPANPNSGTLQQIGGGSGFIVRSDGLIVTNKHVVSDSGATYTVRTFSGKEYPAKVWHLIRRMTLLFLKSARLICPRLS